MQYYKNNNTYDQQHLHSIYKSFFFRYVDDIFVQFKGSYYRQIKNMVS